MKVKLELFFTTVLPAIATLLLYFIPSIEYPLKLIIPLSLATLYFVILGVFLHIKFSKAQFEITTKNLILENEQKEKETLNTKLRIYAEFVHKRKLFINHDLQDISDLIVEYEGYIKNTYRGQKHQEIRVEAGNVKKRAVDTINKEKRDFNEQLFNVQSD